MAYRKCKHGHEMRPSNVNASGQCRKCKRIAAARWLKKHPRKARGKKAAPVTPMA
ncbi:MAG: hypothetical protein ABSB82_16800 [Terriglobia bacterium]|jgi:hypothetical protein